eukprot:UN26143
MNLCVEVENFSTSYGACADYVEGTENHSYCESDADDNGNLAIDVCPECGACSVMTEAPTDGPTDTEGPTDGECADFANTSEEAIALGSNGCLVSYEGWVMEEFCGEYTLVTCSDETWGEAYSTCCPAFCGLCPEDTSDPTDTD